MLAVLAPSDVDLRPVDFEPINNNTIILHESPVVLMSDLYRPTSHNFVPLVEKSNQFFNQMQYEETVMMDVVPRNQIHSSSSLPLEVPSLST